MIGPSGNVRVYLACGVTDMRRGIAGLSALVETVVKEAPGSGAIFGSRGKRADRIFETMGTASKEKLSSVFPGSRWVSARCLSILRWARSANSCSVIADMKRRRTAKH